MITPVKGWAIYEYYPTPSGEQKRLIVYREMFRDCLKIKNALEESNINFEVYQIEGIEG